MTESKVMSIPGPVPNSMASFFVKDQKQEVKVSDNKRRKLSKSASPANGISQDLVYSKEKYIPLKRFSVDLNFAEPNSSLGLSSSDYVDLPNGLPVRILLYFSRYSNALSKLMKQPSVMAECDTQSGPWYDYGKHDCMMLKLYEASGPEKIYMGIFSKPVIIDFWENQKGGLFSSVYDNHRRPPCIRYQSTLHLLSDRKSFRLETTIMWRNSQEMAQMPDSAVQEGLSKFLPYGKVLEGHCCRRPTLPTRTWSTKDFYDNVHIPQDTPSSSSEIKSDLIRCQLLPFQRRAVRWLLQREGVELKPDGQVVPIEITDEELPISFVKAQDADGRTFFVSHLFAVVTTDLSEWYDYARNFKGGILAEEMGLGKTVELLSLICLHRSPSHAKERRSFTEENSGLRKSGATIIITPPAILEQWKQEIKSHAPKLRVFQYLGFLKHDNLTEEGLIEAMATCDIVLTTYDVLRREVHYAEEPPSRSLRNGRASVPRRKTPLVLILWWRVCLDEAQMVDRRVSNVAKTAYLIPRQNAWAVTGTPICSGIDNLLGLLTFLHYEPICNENHLWNRMHHYFHEDCAKMVNSIILRHNKDHVRGEFRLPQQKRVVITIPFNAVEEQHYGQQYDRMCEECNVDASGNPQKVDWDPNDPAIVEKMRNWLTWLRQTCLHPEMAESGRRALGVRNNPLRSVAEVLELMIDQTDMQIRSEERALLLSQLRRGQLLENAMRSQDALDLWTSALQLASEVVGVCRDQLRWEREKCRAVAAGVTRTSVSIDTLTDVDEEEADKDNAIGKYRQRLRAALEVQHICMFFSGNAYYQIKMDSKQTVPDSEEFRSLEKHEAETYEAAKIIRREILADVSGRANLYMRILKEKIQKKTLVHIPKLKPIIYSRGIEAQRLIDRFEDFCVAMNTNADQYDEWRVTIAKLLLQPLIDQEGEELEGDEYERSTKHQDEVYVYMEALRAMFADRSDAVTGQKNTLIDHEVKSGIALARKGNGPYPELFLAVMNTRNNIKPGPELGSLRGIVSELRSLTNSLEWQGSVGSSRARAELEIVNSLLRNTSHLAAEQAKTLSKLEREVEMFRDTMNNRLEYYRQLQHISDTVAPYDEESVGKSLNEELFEKLSSDEAHVNERISALKAKRRYLLHLRDEPESDHTARVCVICQCSFENGVLTVCGHKYCKECLLIWWRLHRTCPSCKTHLKATSFYQITYRPQEFVVQEEKPTAKLEPGPHPKNSIYTDISSGVLSEIKDIELDGSFGTKIDVLSRHILWLRQHDPGAKSVVFSQYRSFLRVLGDAFSHFKIGYSSIDNKDGIERFKNEPTIECFLLHGKAQSSGLNLVNATHVFLCEPLINTAIELQAIARVHRIGQQRPTTVWMYLVSGTVEESIYNLSVSRRLVHIASKIAAKGEEEAGMSRFQNGDTTATTENDTETAIDSANSLEVQNASLAKLMASNTSGGGELVGKDDLWECLFGNANGAWKNGHSIEAQREAGRFLRGEAAEKRKAGSLDS